VLMSHDARQQLKIRVLDSLGCAIGAIRIAHFAEECGISISTTAI
jgi:hypothetical protein